MVSYLLVMVLLTSAVPLVVTPASAQQAGIPFAGGDNELTKDELVAAILPYMLDEGNLKLDDVGDAAYVYAYWNGEPKTCVDQGFIVSPGSVLEAPPKILTLYRPAERIIPLHTRSIDTVRSLKATDRIVAVSSSYTTSKYKTRYPEFFGCDFLIADSKDMESIIDLQPDVVILSSPSEHNIDVLESAGITVLYRAKHYTLDGCVEANRQLGCVIDKEEEADEFSDFYEGWLDLIKETVDEIPEENKPRVYCQHCVGSMRKGYSPYKDGDYGRLPELSGGKVIFADIPGSVSVEEVIARDPEIIVWCGAWGESYYYGAYDRDAGDITMLKAIRDEVMNRAELQNVTAIKNGEVYVIDSNIYCCGGLYFVGLGYLAKIFHPTLFENLDPNAIHQEYLTRFQGLDYDLNEHGVFVYHPEHFPDGH